MPQRIIYEYRRPGKATTTYEEWLVLDRPDVKVLLMDPYEGETIVVDGAPILESGAPAVWHVYPERWFDIGAFHLKDGTLTGWYTNLCRPPILEGDHWVGNDLFLDLWQPVSGDHQWLDEDELADAVRTRLIDIPTHKRIKNERTLIELQVSENAWPPAIVRDIGLGQARALKQA
jgi:predicted RNA-binding protein associated with RNAse of E/G family